MRRIRIHAAAAEEVAEAAAWYEKERPGRGAEFEQAVEAALDWPIADAAEGHSMRRRALRWSSDRATAKQRGRDRSRASLPGRAPSAL